MKVACETLYIAHAFYYTTIFYLMSRFAPYIPSAKAGGFTALLGKPAWCELVINFGLV
jgi:hypothetical protein